MDRGSVLTKRERVLAKVKRDGNALDDAPAFQNDKEIVMAAVKENGHAL